MTDCSPVTKPSQRLEPWAESALIVVLLHIYVFLMNYWWLRVCLLSYSLLAPLRWPSALPFKRGRDKRCYDNNKTPCISRLPWRREPATQTCSHRCALVRALFQGLCGCYGDDTFTLPTPYEWVSEWVRYLSPCRCMQRTVDVWPYRAWTHSPLSASQTRSVRSVEPLITVAPAIWLHHTPPLWPVSVRRHWGDTERRVMIRADLIDHILKQRTDLPTCGSNSC